ncbi:hypothetical protein GGG17_05195 [Arsenicicoccus sp. MKL-02]|uniref:SHOCT domain-containing protein n=1 Tax=Arsenicicoccus cauae TaxID=2663847 RepID=A0A6I3IFB1_9MICO|nr:SHOCT domain-containing protein [Arsenicicoccus cauae]MTB71373.1 hypothetical protein [Arsenicicoccus cauae]
MERQLTLGVGESGTSGSPAFDELRASMGRDHAVRSEVENSLQLLIDRCDPSDRGNRFVVGASVEWIVAAAAWSTGILSAPGGHNVDGFDLQDLQDQARGLWSVKASFQPKPTAFRITNGLGGAGRGLTDPTIFIHPRLPGIVLVHPAVHDDVAAEVKAQPDGTTLAFRPIADHARARPSCVIPLRVPENEHRGKEDAALLFAKGLVSPERFPRLSGIFTAAEPKRGGSVVDEIRALAAMRDSGVLTDEDFSAAKRQVLGG